MIGSQTIVYGQTVGVENRKIKRLAALVVALTVNRYLIVARQDTTIAIQKLIVGIEDEYCIVESWALYLSRCGMHCETCLSVTRIEACHSDNIVAADVIWDYVEVFLGSTLVMSYTCHGDGILAGVLTITAVTDGVVSVLYQRLAVVGHDRQGLMHLTIEGQVSNVGNLNNTCEVCLAINNISADGYILGKTGQYMFALLDTTLADFTAENGVRDTSDIIEKYRKGAFAALPDPELINSLLSIKGNNKDGKVDGK